MADLADEHTQQAFRIRLLHLVRRNKREEANALLAAERSQLPADLEMPELGEVQIGNWDGLAAAMVVSGEEIASRGGRLSVTALDLVNRQYVGTRDGQFPPCTTLQVEARFYRGPPDYDVQQCPRRLLAVRGRSQSWRRQPSMQIVMPLHGLDDLAAHQRRVETQSIRSPDAIRASFLSGWLFWLSVETAAASKLAEGLPNATPVVFGVDRVFRPMESYERDYGPERAESLHLPPNITLSPEQRAKIIEHYRATEWAKEKPMWEDILQQYRLIFSEPPRDTP